MIGCILLRDRREVKLSAYWRFLVTSNPETGSKILLFESENNCVLMTILARWRQDKTGARRVCFYVSPRTFWQQSTSVLECDVSNGFEWLARPEVAQCTGRWHVLRVPSTFEGNILRNNCEAANTAEGLKWTWSGRKPSARSPLPVQAAKTWPLPLVLPLLCQVLGFVVCEFEQIESFWFVTKYRYKRTHSEERELGHPPLDRLIHEL